MVSEFGEADDTNITEPAQLEARAQSSSNDRRDG
jgi:hypothetical protein